MTLLKFESKNVFGPEIQDSSDARLAESATQRRTQFRSTFLGGGALSIGYPGQLLSGQVVDSNDRRLGVELAVPIELDAHVSFSGVGLYGTAAVIYCTSGDDGAYRVGLDLREVRFGDLDFSSFDLLDEAAPKMLGDELL